MPKLVTHWHKVGQDRLFIRHWQCGQKPQGVLHILHGMMEHSGMYGTWSMKLCELGVDVVSHDHPGSGFTLVDKCQRDRLPKDGVQRLMDAVLVVDNWIRTQVSEVEIVRYGHSMGSFLALILSKQLKNRMILSGTTRTPGGLLTFQHWLLAAFCYLFGEHSLAPLAHAITFYPLNRRFKPNATAVDWLSRLPDVLAEYISDPMCGTIPSWGYFYAVNDALTQAIQVPINSLPPTLILTGSQDPLSNGGKKLNSWLNLASTPNVRHVIIDGARHKVEGDGAVVLKHIRDFLNSPMRRETAL
jgi:alpha-beta hydrolase superfamily lysophospholipase